MSAIIKDLMPTQEKFSATANQITDSFLPYTPLNFDEVNKRANELVDHLEAHYEELAHILLEYESYEVVVDEIKRTFDLLRHLNENESYFKVRIGAVTSFLPRNQPLYALSCFVIVPSLMASEVHFRIPSSMPHFFPKLLALIDINHRFPNVKISSKKRLDFLTDRSSLLVNPTTKETAPVTEVVIFTGTPFHADQLRNVFDQRTLFITNGSGHNPVVVGSGADVVKAVEATLDLKLYNQGQDCASPNSILVHASVYDEYMRVLRDGIRTVRVGDYRDRKCRVGPISDPKDLVRIQNLLIENREWLDPTTPGIIRAYDAILEPTIFLKPLRVGANFDEVFAPAIFVQKYDDDKDLALYFEDARYALNAMYVTLYGNSEYVTALVGKLFNGKVLHDANSFLLNSHLHQYGKERGTQPYGGNGYGASSISINGVITPKATLPQRDIFEWIAKPLLNEKARSKKINSRQTLTSVVTKDVQKLLRLKNTDTESTDKTVLSEFTYLDSETLAEGRGRFVQLESENIHQLLQNPNADVITKLSLEEKSQIHNLVDLLSKSDEMDDLDFTTKLYAISASVECSKTENRKRQLVFFKLVYQLLLGKDSGPRLSPFLREIDRPHLLKLIDV